jgi:hypothetical protein
MTRFTEPDEYITGVLQGGLPTCVFHSKPYHRVITQIKVSNSISSIVRCYRGASVGSNLVAQSQVGSANTMTGEIDVPAGQSFYVQWSVVGANAYDATARVSWERDDGPGGTLATKQEWAFTSTTTGQFVEGMVRIGGQIGVNIAAGGGFLSGVSLDTRPYESYLLYQNAVVNGVNNYCQVAGSWRWFGIDNPVPTGLTASFQEDWAFWAQTPSPGANQRFVTSGRHEIANRFYGATGNLTWQNFGPSAVTFDWTLFASMRPIDRYRMAQAAEGVGVAGVLTNNILFYDPALALAAGNIYTWVPLPAYDGPARIHVEGTAAIQVSISYDSTGGLPNVILLNGAGALSNDIEVILPRFGAILFLNRPAGAGTAQVSVVSSQQRF